MVTLLGSSQLEAKLKRSDVAGVYIRSDVNDVDNQSSDVFILSGNGNATYLQGNFIVTNTDSSNPAAFLQTAHGTWAFDPNDDKAIYVSTVGYGVPFMTSQDVIGARYAHRIEFASCDSTKHGCITDRQFIDFTTSDLNAFTTGSLLNPGLGDTSVPGSHLATPRKITKYPSAKKLAIPDLARAP